MNRQPRRGNHRQHDIRLKAGEPRQHDTGKDTADAAAKINQGQKSASLALWNKPRQDHPETSRENETDQVWNSNRIERPPKKHSHGLSFSLPPASGNGEFAYELAG